MSTPRAPLLMAALAFAGGILAGQWWWRPPTWWAIAAVWFLASAAWLLRQKPRCGYACGLGAMVALGALAIQARQGEAANTLGARDLGAFVGRQEVTHGARHARGYGARRRGRTSRIRRRGNGGDSGWGGPTPGAWRHSPDRLFPRGFRRIRRRG